MEILGLTFDFSKTFKKERLVDITTAKYRKTKHGYLKIFEHFYHVSGNKNLVNALKDDFVSGIFMWSGSGLLGSIARGIYFGLFINYKVPAVIGKSFKIVNYSKIKIGRFFWAKDNVTLFSGGILNIGDSVVLAERSTIWSGESGVYIGNDFFLGIGSYISAIGGVVKIGNDVMIADHVSLYTWNHRYLMKNITFSKMGGTIEEIVIGNNCWIGTGCKILAGTKLGDNCVVAAGSVLTKKYPNNSVIAGIPAKVIKKIQ
ncbi:MAG: acetyl transferase [uncultured bacterium]|nr:MAG: acetyl transferase [uncultured bacterium]